MVNKTNKKQSSSLVFLKYFFAIALWCTIGIVTLCSAWALNYTIETIKEAPLYQTEDLLSQNSSLILDSNGQVIAELGVQLRYNISYNDLPHTLIDAFIAIEDSRFFVHNGFDVPRFTKALQENIQASLDANELTFVQGGSTLTMQLIDNTYFIENLVAQNIDPIDQKIQEIYISLNIENELDKESIFINYLNKLNFGANIRGIQKAAEYYFNKNVNEITLSESALLAGIVNLPNSYNPYYHLEFATQRRNEVLDMMEYHGYISESECSLAKSINIQNQLTNNGSVHGSDSYTYQSYIDAVIDEVIDKTGFDPSTTPMVIHTHMKQEIQNTVESIQNSEVDSVVFPDDLMQVAIAVMDNQNGHIVALGGGRNYEGERMFNRATDMQKQPGSSVKPFLSYALAFEHLGWSTNHVVVDRPIEYRGTSTVLHNFDGKYRGDMILQDAMSTSMNTPALQTLQEVSDTIGVDKTITYLQNIGFSNVTRNNFDLGYAIGGSSFLSTPLQLAGAHATLLNQGEYIEPHTIQKIEFYNDTPTYFSNPEINQALSPEAAFLAAYLMEDNVSKKYFNYMQILQRDYPVYAKTGTTDWGTEGITYGIPEGAMKDKWMVFSTTEYTTSVWIGYDQAIKDKDTYFDYEKSKLNLTGHICNHLLDSLYPENSFPSPLYQPENIVEISYVLGSFPYAIAPGYEYLYTTGLIQKKDSELSSIYDQLEASLSRISFNHYENGDLEITFHSNISSGSTKNISLHSQYNTVIAYGLQILDSSKFIGTPTYYATIYINGQYSHEISSQDSTIWDWSDQSQIRVCGYFITTSNYKSNTVCSN